MGKLVVIVLSVLSVAQWSSAKVSEDVILPQGTIRGFQSQTTTKKPMFIFYRIPYAKPPVGELRFQDPLPPDSWDGTLNATVPSPMCPQFNMLLKIATQKYDYMGQEDCLYLNVYTPKSDVKREPLSVMVYIHGGGFLAGSAIEGEGHDLLDQDVVLVALNYRLGILGFSSTGDDFMPGNYGLKDQSLALQWVRDNIEHFGGDPSKVTIFGQSAGGASVHYHLLARGSTGLFQRAILQSGTAVCPWANWDGHREDAIQLAKSLHCPLPSRSNEQNKSFLKCLQNKDVFEIIKTIEHLIVSNVGPVHFTPRVDGKFITENPETLLKKGQPHMVDIIIGNTRDEGGFLTYGPLIFESEIKQFREDLGHFGSYIMTLETESDAQIKTKKILQFYKGLTDTNDPVPEQIKELLGDRQFKICSLDTAILHAEKARSQGKNVYMYNHAHKGNRSIGQLFPVGFGQQWIHHVEELFLLFPMTLFGGYPERSPKDAQMSQTLVKLWTNFAKTGNPTPDKSLGFEWTAFVPKKSPKRLSLQLEPLMEYEPLDEAREFWDSLGLVRRTLLNGGVNKLIDEL